MCVCVLRSRSLIAVHSYTRTQLRALLWVHRFQFILSFSRCCYCCLCFFFFFVNNNENTLKHARTQARHTQRESAHTHTHVHYSTCMYTRFMAFCKCICICMSTCTCVWLLTFHYFCCCCWWLLLLLAREGKPKGKKSIHTARKHFGRITFQIAQNLRIIESVIEFSLLKQQHYSPCFGRARSVSHSRTRTHESHHNRQNFHTFSHEPENERLLNVRVVQRVLVD